MISKERMRHKLYDEYVCSITQQIMYAPVCTADNQTYEREAISKWLETNNTSPNTNLQLPHKILTHNNDKFIAVRNFLEHHPELDEELYLPQELVTKLLEFINANQITEIAMCVSKNKQLLKIALEEGKAYFKLLYKRTKNTLLHELIMQGEIKPVAWFVDAQHDIEISNQDGNTPLLLAALHNKTNLVKFLLSKHANPAARNSQQYNIITIAALNNNHDILKLVLTEDIADLPVLHMALELDDVLMLRAILQKNQSYDLEAKNNKQVTPLYVAVEKNNLAAVKMLLERNASTTIHDDAQQTLLHIACVNNNPEIIARLLQTQLNIDAFDISGNTALHLAAKLGFGQIATILLSSRANYKTRNFEGQTPLELAIKYKQCTSAKLIETTIRTIKINKINAFEQLANKVALLEKEKINLTISVKRLEREKTTMAKTLETHTLRISRFEEQIAKENISLQSLLDDNLKIKNQADAFPAVILSATSTNKSKKKSDLFKTHSEQAEQQKSKIMNLLPKFLQLVVEGKQSQVEVMLQQCNDLGKYAGDITDLSGRCFNDGITGFQYSVWALDWHMWVMLSKYLELHEIKQQLQEMQTKAWCNQYDKQVSWKNLIDALDGCIDMCNKKQWNEANILWCTDVREAQRLLPAHVVNEYCHPDCSFDSIRNFNEPYTFPRLQTVDTGEEWFSAINNNNQIGSNLAIYRGGCRKATLHSGNIQQFCWHIATDKKALSKLLFQRIQLAEEFSHHVARYTPNFF